MSTDLTIIPIETPTLGDRSYLVHDGEVAFVVDPQRDIDRVLDLLDEHQVRLTDVFETHIHNDYVTGGLALAQRTGAAYHVNAEDEVSFERTPIRDGADRRGRRPDAADRAGDPGPHLHPPLLRADRRRAPAGSDGRSACSPAARCCTAPPAAPTCSARSTPTRWSATSTPRPTGWPTCSPTQAEVFPTHGFGSFCSATQSDATDSTIGQEKQSNPVLTQDEETYVRELLDGLGAWPAYYAHMAPANAAGPSEPDLAPPARGRPRRAPPAHRGRRVGRRPAQPHRVRRRPRARHPQLRPRRRLRDLPGLADHLGHPGHPARRDPRGRRRGPARAGPHRHRPPRRRRPPAGPRTGPTVSSLASRPPPSPTSPRSATTATWSSWTSAAPTSTTRPGIKRRGQHPHPRAAPAASTRSPTGEVWVHCASGYRASVAASLLDAAGRTPGRHRRHLRQRREGRPAPGRRPERVTLLLAVAAGALIGLSLGALGGGGSILAVPVLVYALGQTPAQATTGSLVVVGVTSLIGAVTAHRAGNVLLGRGVTFGVVAIGGAAAGREGLGPRPRAGAAGRVRRPDAARRRPDGRPAAPPRAAAAIPAHDASQAPSSRRPTLDDPIITFSPTFACQCPRALKVLVTATAVGLLTGFLGVGGGFLVVPALVLALALPMDVRRRHLPGRHHLDQRRRPRRARRRRHHARLGPGRSPSPPPRRSAASLGARLADRIDTTRLSAAFTVLVLAVAVYTAARALPALV